ncbi:unnamed protein product [Leptidea sinapis]|uniref:Uncharacterized protein n=1 Tax=Leptidea sinapis TaxID=189913 RepID=A0A5E4PT22_9NEOP|nr:unnamed protein product [Leptidea sinapis]
MYGNAVCPPIDTEERRHTRTTEPSQHTLGRYAPSHEASPCRGLTMIYSTIASYHIDITADYVLAITPTDLLHVAFLFSLGADDV